MLGLLEVRDTRFTQSPMAPLGLGYLVSYAEKLHGPGSVWVARNVQDLISRQPRAAGISVCSPFMRLASDLAREIKERAGIPIILGGPHISALPAYLPSWADVGVVGEGEATLTELLGCLTPKGWEQKTLEQIAGIVFRSNGKIRGNPARAPLEPLDQIPIPRRDQLLSLSSSEEMSLMTSRGTPYRTAWTPSWVGRSLRLHSAEYVAREIRELVQRFSPRFIGFQDEVFPADRARLRTLVEILEADRVCEKVTFGAVVRPNLFNREICQLLVRMNLRSVLLPFYSGSDRVLKRLGKGLSVRQNQRALDLCYENGIIVDGSFYLFTPEEEVRDIRETIEFRKRNAEKLRIAEFAPAVPYPGTSFWNTAAEMGLVSVENGDWHKLDPCLSGYVCANSSVSLEELSALGEELDKIYK